MILDVVYNHTGEGNHLGPTLSLGARQPTYYWLKPDDAALLPGLHRDRQQPELGHPQTLKLVMDSLRYWVRRCTWTGSASTWRPRWARTRDFDRNAPFFQAIHQDPVLSRVKLIAEPWDVGMGGYQVGDFPVDWAEWNGRYRDAVRRYWKGDDEPGGRDRVPADRVGRPVPARGAEPGQHQLHHRARRVHAPRPGHLRAEAQRGQRGGEPGRHRRQPVLELRRRGRDRRPGDHRAARAAEAQLPGHAASSRRACR